MHTTLVANRVVCILFRSMHTLPDYAHTMTKLNQPHHTYIYTSQYEYYERMNNEEDPYTTWLRSRNSLLSYLRASRSRVARIRASRRRVEPYSPRVASCPRHTLPLSRRKQINHREGKHGEHARERQGRPLRTGGEGSGWATSRRLMLMTAATGVPNVMYPNIINVYYTYIRHKTKFIMNYKINANNTII